MRLGSVAGVHVAVTPEGLVLTTADQPIAGDGQRWTFANGATLISGSRGLWHPSRTLDQLSTTMWAGTITSWHLPWRFLLIVSVPIALLFWGLWWRARKVFPPGSCARCGYDLGGATSDRCPECGATPAIMTS